MIAQNARDRAARGRSYRSPKDAGQVNATRVDPTTADEPPPRGGVSVACHSRCALRPVAYPRRDVTAVAASRRLSRVVMVRVVMAR
jgi:hypothetical protein